MSRRAAEWTGARIGSILGIVPTSETSTAPARRSITPKVVLAITALGALPYFLLAALQA